MSAPPGGTPLPRLDLLVRDIEGAIASGDHGRQSDLIRRSAAALTRHWSRLPQADKPGFDRLLASLLDQVDGEARATFARCLTPLRRAPRITTTRLAFDPFPSVAAPLLEHCPSFDDEWLLHLIRHVGRGHREVIARRRTLTKAVVEALLEGDDPAVAAALLTNPGAAFDTGALERLLPGASTSLPLMLALATRADLPEAGRASLAALARRTASQALTEEGEFDREEADDLLDRVARTFREPVCPERLARHAVSAAIVGRSPGTSPAGSARIAGCLERRRLEDALAILARDVSLPVDVLVACHDAPMPHALAMVMRGLGHPWPLLKALLQAAPGGGISPECLGVAHRLTFEVGARTARMVVRYAAIQSGTAAFVSAAGSDDGHHAMAAARAPEGASTIAERS